MINHTPRPWTADSRYHNYAVRIVGADGRFVASSSWHDDSPYYPTKSETFENFAVIAQAVNSFPELLECLKEARRLLTDQDAIDLAHIDEVIAKASATGTHYETERR